LLTAINSTPNLNIDNNNILAYNVIELKLNNFKSLNNIKNLKLKDNVTINGDVLKSKLGILCTIN
jgi:hypothetical protein